MHLKQKKIRFQNLVNRVFILTTDNIFVNTLMITNIQICEVLNKTCTLYISCMHLNTTVIF